MKKHIYPIIMVILGLLPNFLFAQKVRIGFVAGPDLTFIRYDKHFPGPVFYFEVDRGDYLISRKAEPGYRYSVGPAIDYDIKDKLFLSAGLNFQGRSHKITLSKTSNVTGELLNEDQEEFTVYSLQLPLLLHYRMGKFTIGAGGYAAQSFAGKLKFQGGSRKLEFGNVGVEENGTVLPDAADFQPFDAGLRTEVGYGIKRWRVTAYFDLGLVNIAHKVEYQSINQLPEKYTLKKQTLGLSFVYQPWPR